MAYSNTTGNTTINVDQLLSYAFRDAGKTAEEMTPEFVKAGPATNKLPQKVTKRAAGRGR